MRKKFAGVFLVLALVTSLISGCAAKAGVSKEDQGKKVTVYTSFYAMYDFTKKIGGDRVDIINLVPPGTEPHEWEPAPRDIAGLANSDVFIYNGAGMEGWVDKVLAAVDNKNLLVVEAAKGLKLLKNQGPEDLPYDPHLWLNPMLAKKQLEAIKKALTAADPANQDYYEKNFAENAGKLDELDQEYKAAVAGFKQKDIVVAHQAFGYLCDAYGLRQVAISGLTADAEPAPGRMAEIAKFARSNKVKYIFFEELSSPKVADVIAREAGVKTAVLNPFEGPGENDRDAEKEYFSVMRANLAALQKALN